MGVYVKNVIIDFLKYFKKNKEYTLLLDDIRILIILYQKLKKIFYVNEKLIISFFRERKIIIKSV